MIKKCLGLFMGFACMICGTAFAAAGTADIRGTSQEPSTISGTAVLEDTPKGLKVSVDFRGVPPGKHGFHIHEKDSCADEGKAAGGHYNPEGAPHGLLSKDGLKHAHAGDMGNVEIAADGTGKVEALLTGITLADGQYNVAGRTLILHEKEDDFGQPTGNAGGRIGCGQIQLTPAAKAVEATPYASPKLSAEFERIKALEGRWEGTVSEKGQENKPAIVEYRITSGGSAVEEKLGPGTPQEMVSMYHDAKGKLSMTHYCMLGNQPQLELKSSSAGKIHLLESAASAAALEGQMRMRELVIEQPDKDSLTQTWTAVGADGKAMGPTVMKLEKSDPAAARAKRRKLAAELAAKNAPKTEVKKEENKTEKKEEKKK